MADGVSEAEVHSADDVRYDVDREASVAGGVPRGPAAPLRMRARFGRARELNVCAEKLAENRCDPGQGKPRIRRAFGSA